MTEACHTCGAVLPEGSTCQTILDEFLALEFTDPRYGQVHFLTVACFMVQHNGYSDSALVWIQSALRNYLEDGRNTQQIRRKAIKSMAERSKEIRRTPDAAPLSKVAWSMTIADVAAQMHDAESYCKLIEQRGYTTLQEMTALHMGKI
ncbi:MAG: DUF5946 family protein [Bacillota bacterium]